MRSSNRISVVTVVKNGENHLEETIQSVIEKMALVDMDYIVIDGGSIDGTTNIIRKYNDKISYWISEQDNGIYDAMNKGWAAAPDNSFIMFLGAGDLLISLPEIMDNFTSQDVIYGDVLIGRNTVFKSSAGFLLKLYNSMHHQALLVNKALHPDAPFNTTYKIFADFDFNQRLMKSGVRFIYSAQLIAYAQRGGVSDQNHFIESVRVIYRNFGCFWSLLALGSYCMMKTFPFMKHLGPHQKR